jgi:dephospho-CoA kinase
MRILGLVGGVASGKSFVADCFGQLGAAVLDADRAGHDVLRDADVIAAITQRWGQGMLDASGSISRGAVARIVFAPGSEAQLRFLEGLTHPRIQIRIQQQLQQLRAAPLPPPLVVLDAALLFEAGWDKICDGVVFVDCPRETRLSRATARGWSQEQFAAREAAQWPVDEKRRRSKHVIDNSQDRAHALAQVRELWHHLVTA